MGVSCRTTGRLYSMEINYIMMKRISRIYYLWVNFVMFFLLFNVLSIAQKVDYNSPGRGNPIIPGYFADPTIKKFGDTYYLYSTTDGIKLASGEPQVWISKDFVNWFNYEMDIDIPLGRVYDKIPT